MAFTAKYDVSRNVASARQLQQAQATEELSAQLERNVQRDNMAGAWQPHSHAIGEDALSSSPVQIHISSPSARRGSYSPAAQEQVLLEISKVYHELVRRCPGCPGSTQLHVNDLPEAVWQAFQVRVAPELLQEWVDHARQGGGAKCGSDWLSFATFARLHDEAAFYKLFKELSGASPGSVDSPQGKSVGAQELASLFERNVFLSVDIAQDLIRQVTQGDRLNYHDFRLLRQLLRHKADRDALLLREKEAGLTQDDAEFFDEQLGKLSQLLEAPQAAANDLVERTSAPNLGFSEGHHHITGCGAAWRQPLCDFLYSRAVEHAVLLLLLCDVLIVIIELVLIDVKFHQLAKSCNVTSLEAPSAEDVHAHGRRLLLSAAEGEHHEESTIARFEHVLHILGLTIVVIFAVEVLLHIIAVGPLDFFTSQAQDDEFPSQQENNKKTGHRRRVLFWHVFDFFIVYGSLTLEFYYYFTTQGMEVGYGELLVLLRLWRVIRIGHGLVTVEQRKMQEAMQETLGKQVLELQALQMRARQKNVLLRTYQKNIQAVRESLVRKDKLLQDFSRSSQLPSEQDRQDAAQQVLEAWQLFVQQHHLSRPTKEGRPAPPPVQFHLLGGAALFFHGLRPHLHELDLWVPALDQHVTKFGFHGVMEEEHNSFVFKIHCSQFVGLTPSELRNVHVWTEDRFGLSVMSCPWLLRVKLRLGRPQDRLDIENLRARGVQPAKEGNSLNFLLNDTTKANMPTQANFTQSEVWQVHYFYIEYLPFVTVANDTVILSSFLIFSV
eukprot:g50117.t1